VVSIILCFIWLNDILSNNTIFAISDKGGKVRKHWPQVSTSCWVIILYNTMVQTSEIGLSLLGSANLPFCRIHLFLKNALVSISQNFLRP
jgi:hypothetical protein